jgi:hypothetical protein
MRFLPLALLLLLASVVNAARLLAATTSRVPSPDEKTPSTVTPGFFGRHSNALVSSHVLKPFARCKPVSMRIGSSLADTIDSMSEREFYALCG